MRNRSVVLLGLCCAVTLLVVSLVLVLPENAFAQGTTVPRRITSAIDESNLVTLTGNTHPLARPQFDRGAAPASLPMQRMLLVLKRSSTQEVALETLLEQQQDASSASFHRWLTPQQFGQQFGPADADIQTITTWLQSHGFTVAGVSNGRTTIEFSGVASQVREAFHTSIHRYVINGAEHFANSSDPQIPAALAPVVAGVNTLYNFPRRGMHEVVGVFARTRATGAVAPVGGQYTFPNPCNPTAQPFCNFAVAPADFSKIYTVPNLFESPAPPTVYNGNGQTIAIVGQSNINTSDVAQFRSLFGLPAPNLNVILSGPDPGLVPDDETEADLDVQWSGAVAPDATIDFVVAQSTDASLGVDLAAQYVVDNNLAPVMSESFGICEFLMGTADNIFYNQIWQQAAAQGITVNVSSGDGGSALCDFNVGTEGAARFGLSVSGFASTPYNVAVGGTDFNDVNSFATYWNTTPADTPTVASAKGYIPEMTWNDTCTNQELFTFFDATTAEQDCNNAQAQQDGLLNIVAGSGGLSACTVSDGQNESTCSGGYAKPSWQTALTPHDSKRDLPDVSLFASNGFNSSFYLICEVDLSVGTPSCDPNMPVSDAVAVGGTSASSPAFAGIMALVNQATGSRQGNANYVLYKLAAQSGASCSSASPTPSCVFYDVPSGSTIAMPCVNGSLNCTISSPYDSVGVLSGYAATSGYDLATGLGSVNAANLIAQWKTFSNSLTPSTTTLSLNSGNPVSITHGQPVSVAIGVAPGSGTGTPTGNVSLIANTAPPSAPSEVTQQGLQEFTLTNGDASGTTNVLPGGTSYTVFASYPGDGTFAASTSSPVSVTVNPESSSTSVQILTVNQNGQAVPFTSGPYGSEVVVRGNVAGSSGKGNPTGAINFTDGITNPATSLSGDPFALNSQGYTETQFLTGFSTGTHSIVATYNGDSSFNTSTSAAATFTIVPTSTTTLANGPNSAVVNSPVTLNANIAANIAGPTPPTGTITFLMGTTPVATANVAGTVVPTTPATAYAYVSATVSTLPHGQDNITARYSGDANYAASTSAPFVVSVLYATSTSIASSASSILEGQPVTFTAQVTSPQTGGPPFTGTVTFSGSAPLQNTAVPVSSSGQAQFTTSALASPTAFVYASYSGDTNYAQTFMVASASVTVTPAFTIAANPTAINIPAPGQTGTTTLTIAANDGFSGTATLSASSCSGLPSEATCSFSPSSISLSGSNASATTTLTITTTASAAASNIGPASKGGPSAFSGWNRLEEWNAAGTFVLAGLLLLAFAAVASRRGRRRISFATFALALLALLLVDAGCGGGGGGGGGSSTPSNPGTPAGTSYVTVTVTINGITHTVSNLQVSIQ
jgi:subtilase family serine protease